MDQRQLISFLDRIEKLKISLADINERLGMTNE